MSPISQYIFCVQVCVEAERPRRLETHKSNDDHPIVVGKSLNHHQRLITKSPKQKNKMAAPTSSIETYCTFTLAADVTAGGLPSEEDIAKDLESSDDNVRGFW